MRFGETPLNLIPAPDVLTESQQFFQRNIWVPLTYGKSFEQLTQTEHRISREDAFQVWHMWQSLVGF